MILERFFQYISTTKVSLEYFFGICPNKKLLSVLKLIVFSYTFIGKPVFRVL